MLEFFSSNTTLQVRFTGRVSRVDDAEDPRIAVLPGFIQGSPELLDIQTPALVLVQVITDLHSTKVCQGC